MSPIRSSTIAALAIALVFALSRAGVADDEKDKPLPPEEVTLKTSDGLTVSATFYPSKLGKDAVPLILLHAEKGGRADFKDLALTLQADGHAVIAPDVRVGAPGAGEPRPADLEAVVTRDIEAVKKFLVAKNNAGELNIERLGVVGVELGATLAVNWAALDWSWPVLATGKQGQDVKGLALVSPQWSYKGMSIAEAVGQPSVQADLAVLIVTGRRNSKLLGEAKRLHSALERHHPAPPAGKEDELQTLWLKTPSTSLQGMQLVGERSFQVGQMIREFVELRLANPPFAWSVRKSPLQ
jgi:pimeloyl-ACP methyl ester carboxylesterase